MQRYSPSFVTLITYLIIGGSLSTGIYSEDLLQVVSVFGVGPARSNHLSSSPQYTTAI